MGLKVPGVANNSSNAWQATRLADAADNSKLNLSGQGGGEPVQPALAAIQNNPHQYQ